jgi:hypothetical protein
MNWRPPQPSGRAAALLLAAGLLAAAWAAATGRGPARRPPDGSAGWIERLAALQGATPEAARQAERAAAAAQAQLETAQQFAGRLRAWSPGWRAESRAREQRFGLELRRYLLTCTDRSPRAWAAALELLRALAECPGVTVEQLAITAAPGGAGAFTQLELVLAVRLRP